MSDNIPEKPKAAFERAIVARQAEIMEMAAPNVRQDSAWLTRAKFTLLTSECAPLLQTPRGMASAMEAMTNAAMAGLTFGGPRPECYPVPRDGKVVLMIEASGHKNVCTYSPGAMLAEMPTLYTVREGDGTRIDEGAGEIIFPMGGIDPFSESRGKIVGWLMRLVFNDGRTPKVVYCPVKKVREIQAKYSNLNSPMFKKSPEEADENTATKYMLRPYTKAAIQRAKVKLEGFDFDEQTTPPPKPIERDVTERTATRLDKAVETMTPDPEPVVEEDVHEEVEAEPENQEQAKPEQDGDLFH